MHIYKITILILVLIVASCVKEMPNKSNWVEEPKPLGILKDKPLFYGFPVSEPNCESHDYSSINGKLGFLRIEYQQDKDQYLLKWSKKVAGPNCSDRTKFDCYVSSEKKQKILAKSKVRKLEDMLKQIPQGDFKNNLKCNVCGSENIIIGSSDPIEGHMYVPGCEMGGSEYSGKLKQIIDYIQSLIL